MHKEELLVALCTALGIQAHEHHEVVGIDKSKVKAKIRALTCVSLARLEHAAAIPVLLDALRDRDETVQASAHAALSELTGVDLEPDAQAWDAWWQALG